jgi:hypothetical protein
MEVMTAETIEAFTAERPAVSTPGAGGITFGLLYNRFTGKEAKSASGRGT